MVNEQGLEVSERVRRLLELFVDYDQVQAVRAELEWRHTSPHPTGHGAMLTLLLGRSGSGKTTIVKRYADRFPATRGPTGSVRPVLYVSLPCPCSIKAMAVTILGALGDPLADKTTTTASVSRRIIKQLVGQQVGLLIIDEFQHLIDLDRARVLREASDWLKTLLDQAEVPVVCVGLPESIAILEANAQLDRRTDNRIILKPFEWDGGSKTTDFRMFLALIDQALPFGQRSGLGRTEVAKKIFDASSGLAGQVVRLVRKAGIVAARAGDNAIAPHHFAEACHQLGLKQNPFEGPTTPDLVGLDAVAVSRNVRGMKRKPRISDHL